MQTSDIIQRLNYNAKIFDEILSVIPEAQARWKPAPDKWSMLEVVNHLYDEERDDFRKRLDLTLHQPETEWPPIDPPGWVMSHKYMEQNFNESVIHFLAERTASISWLRSLKSPGWEHVHNHPKFGPIKAGDLLVSWLTHDYLHIRQLVNLNVLFMQELAQPYSTRYASP
ncbi:DinB family protein [candidate division KSB1 bacterium]|nr:DinB family protein [candidate division KSB1 bacterium]